MPTLVYLTSNFNLEGNSPSESPLFLRKQWFQFLEKYTLHKSKTPVTLLLKNNAEQISYLPLVKKRHCSKFGSWNELKSLSNFYSPFYSLAGESDNRATCISQILHEQTEFLKVFDVVNLVPVLAHETSVWIDSLKKIGFKTHTYHHSTNWFHPDIRDVDDYWAKRPSRLTNTIERRKKKLSCQFSVDIVIVEPSTINELYSYLADYHNIYYHSWKKAEPYPAFIDAIATYTWKTNELRLGIMYLDGVPAAAQMWFVTGKTASIFKLAHKTEFDQHSIGTVLTASILEYVIEQDNVSYVDFLTGDDSYKKDWMQESQPLYGIQGCSTTSLTGCAGIAKNSISRLSNYFIANLKK